MLGIVGCTILINLGIWQSKRLEWKTEVLSEIDKKLKAFPGDLPQEVSKNQDQYRSVGLTGRFIENELHVLTSIKFKGPGYRVIAPFLLDDGRLIMVDRGFILETEKLISRPLGIATIKGNLLWPNETDNFTPEPNFELNIWFSREINLMSKELGTEPILLVLKESDILQGPDPQPIGINIPNNHLGYAITWFSLAIVWFGMTGYLLWRIKFKSL
jgi:surfeit locus 1 family protein